MTAAESADPPWERVVRCTDALGRARDVAIHVDDDGIGITTPPGESARWGDAEGAQLLRNALADAIVEYRLRTRGEP